MRVYPTALGAPRSRRARAAVHRVLAGIALGLFWLGTQARAVEDRSVVACWRFDEGAGAIAADASGNGHDCVLSDPVWVDGIAGKALFFDRGQCTVGLVKHTPRLALKTFALSFWFLTDQPDPSDNQLFVKMRDGKQGFRIIADGGRIVFQVPTEETAFGCGVTSDRAYRVKEWNHVVCQYDGRAVQLYLNGRPSGSAARTGSPGPSADPLFIGGWGEAGVAGFRGIMDEVKVYDRPLAAAEIEAIYRQVLAAARTPAFDERVFSGNGRKAEPPVDVTAGCEPIATARIDTAGGSPRLFVNGHPLAPVVFFYNTRQFKNYVEKYQKPQVALAADAGVHAYQFLIPVPSFARGFEAGDYTALEEVMTSFVRQDPRAYFILRVSAQPQPDWPGYAELGPNDFWTYADGRTDVGSPGSERFRALSLRGMAALVRHVEASPFGRRVLGYNIGAAAGVENFADQFRERGPDVSGANTASFRRWLRTRYGHDDGLQRAWGDASATLATAEVPRCEPGRLPFHTARDPKPIAMFYSQPGEQAWIDFSEYQSECLADLAIGYAELIKKETGGRKLSFTFFGYVSELVGSFGGHSAFMRLLTHAAIDVLCSPGVYNDRTVGEPGGFMTAIESVAAHGKLWMNENDLHTHALGPGDYPGWLTPGLYGRQTADLAQTVSVLDREFAHMFAHGAGTWWMDLGGGGAFRDPGIWDLMKARLPMLKERIRSPSAFRSDVAVVWDEWSKCLVKADWDGFYGSLVLMRSQCRRLGFTPSEWLLEDFCAGIGPAHRAYIFPNAFRLTRAQRTAIRSRLAREKATAIWIYAPGRFDAEGRAGNTGAFLGMSIRQDRGETGSEGVGRLAGMRWGSRCGQGRNGYLVVDPRLVVDDPAVTVLGRYLDGGQVSAAVRLADGRRDYYFADLSVSYEALGAVLQDCGVHRWTRGGEIVITDGRWLALHTGTGGTKRIHLPPGASLKPVGVINRNRGGSALIDRDRELTVWFRVQWASTRK